MKYYQVVNKRRLLCENEKYSIYCHSGKLYIEKYNRLKNVVSLPINKKAKTIVFIRAFERMLRLEPRFAHFISEDCFVFSFHRAMYCYSIEKNIMKKEFQYRDGMNNPLMLWCGKSDEGKKRIIFGEYWGNTKNEAVNIYERDWNGTWRILYTFPPGKVCHIHFITYDSTRKCFWILTGDSDPQSAIWKADVNFKKVVPILRGRQIYRSCFLYPTTRGLIYATDSPNEKNYIFFVNLNEESADLKIMYDMPGPCIFGRVTNEGEIVMATSVEPDSSKLKSIRYLISRKRGKGVRDNNSYVIYGSENSGFDILLKLKKDILFMGLFQFGNFYFPECDNLKSVKVCPIALSKYDGKTLEIDTRSDKDDE